MSQITSYGQSTTPIPPGTYIQTISGNDGVAESPDFSGNFNIITANSTPQFIGSANTETLDFNLLNLVLGSSLPSLTTGDRSVGMGSDALMSITSARNSTAIGYRAGRSLTTPINSTFIGSFAGQLVTSGASNTAVGALALSSATTGAANAGSNLSVGSSSLLSLTTGHHNTGLGTGVLFQLVSGTYNTAVGFANSNPSGSAYTGAESSNLLLANVGVLGESNTMRLGNTGSGDGQVNRCFVAGVDGVNVGSVATVVTESGTQLGTAVITAGTNITVTPAANLITIAATTPATVATSYLTQSGSAVPAANILTVNGAHNINTSAAGSTVTINGDNAITLGDLSAIAANSNAISCTTGDINIAAGNLKLPDTNTAATQGVVKFGGVNYIHNYGTTSFYAGYQAGNFTNTGSNNNAIGALSLDSCTSGSSNCAFGPSAATQVSTGSFNVCVGGSSGANITSGTTNTCIGQQSGSNFSTGSYNLILGFGSGDNYVTSETSNVCINNSGVASENHTIRLGETGVGAAQQDRCFIAGTDGVNVGSTAKVVTMGSGGTAEQIGTATITAGVNISVVPTANVITINATGAGSFSWSVIVADQTAAINNGYFCNKAGTLALALPAASVVGDVIEVSNENTANGIQFTQAAGQQIFIGTANTTLGATGTLTSNAVGDTLKIVCRVANTVWVATSMIGNWTPA